MADPHGRDLAFTGLRMRPRDLLKIGRLALDHGPSRGQRLFVVPELDLTLVITAGDYGSREIGHTVNRLFEQVVASVER